MSIDVTFLSLHVPEPPGHDPNPPPTTPPETQPGREIDLPPLSDPDEVREPDETPPPAPDAPTPPIH